MQCKQSERFFIHRQKSSSSSSSLLLRRTTIIIIIILVAVAFRTSLCLLLQLLCRNLLLERRNHVQVIRQALAHLFCGQRTILMTIIVIMLPDDDVDDWQTPHETGVRDFHLGQLCDDRCPALGPETRFALQQKGVVVVLHCQGNVPHPSAQIPRWRPLCQCCAPAGRKGLVDAHCQSKVDEVVPCEPIYRRQPQCPIAVLASRSTFTSRKD